MDVQVKHGIRMVAASLVLSASAAMAQFAGPAVSSTAARSGAPESALKASYGDVTIMPGDVISISTYGAPELTTSTMTNTTSNRRLPADTPVSKGIIVR